MITETEKELIEKSFSILRIIWLAMLGTLIVYLFICYQFGNQIQQPPGSQYPLATLRNIFFGLAAVTLLISHFLRRFMLTGRSGSSATTPSKSPSPSDLSPILGKYATALIISLALSESIGIFGLVLFILGDSYQTLYIFVGISAIAMFFYRPKKQELVELIRVSMQGVGAIPSK
jgi:hypothetical protein